MAKADKGFKDLVAHLNKISNLDYLTEEAQLRSAATAESHSTLPSIPTTTEDITKLAGIKENPAMALGRVAARAAGAAAGTTAVNRIADKVLGKNEDKEEEGRPSPANPTGKSAIASMIEETDTTLKGQLTRVGITEAQRLEKIADLEKQIAELKAQEIEENTYDPEKFKVKLRELLEYFLKNANMDQMVDMYKMIADENIKVGEDGRVTIGDLVNEVEDNEEDLELDEYSDEKEESGFTDKQIKMAFGVLNDPKFKGGNYDGAVEVINKIAPGLADHPSVANALKRANEDLQEYSEPRAHEIKIAGDYDQESGVSDKDAEEIQAMLKDAGIEADVQPSERSFDRVIVHTMSDKDSVIRALGDVVDEGTKDFSNDVEKVTEAKKKPKPTKPSLWSRAKAEAKKKFDVYPSAYANAWAAKWYKGKGGGWR